MMRNILQQRQNLSARFGVKVSGRFIGKNHLRMVEQRTGNDYALLLAFLVTLLDALPVFGTGTALVPWALLSLLFSSVPKAIALLALYLCTLLVRNVLEPKLLASQAGLPPVASLFAMYLGFCTFGVAGMIAFPFLLLLAAQTYRLGTQAT